jgi:hypothetical protein
MDELKARELRGLYAELRTSLARPAEDYGLFMISLECYSDAVECLVAACC